MFTAMLISTRSETWAANDEGLDRLTKEIDDKLKDPKFLASQRMSGEDAWLTAHFDAVNHGMFGYRREDITIPEQAVQLIIAQEVGGRAYFDKFHLEHLIYPGGKSGPTFGMGYDIGQLSNDSRGRKNLRDDWEGLLSDNDLEQLSKGLALTGPAAQQFSKDNRNIVVDYEIGNRQLRERMLPYLIGDIFDTLKSKIENLPPACLGALCSLAYNRGVTFTASGKNYEEMRNIAFDLANNNAAAVPGELLAMRRLWPKTSGLYARREIEAKMFQAGLIGAGLPTVPLPLP
jgi:hypothetical protein